MVQPRRSSRHARRARTALHHVVLALVAALTLAATPLPAAAQYEWLEFEDASHGLYDGLYHVWLVNMCPGPEQWDEPCAFPSFTFFIRFDVRRPLGNLQVTEVQVRLNLLEPWGTLPVPGLPKQVGRVQVAALAATVPCGQNVTKHVYVRLNLSSGSYVEEGLSVDFKCLPCTPPPEYRVDPPEDEPPWDPFKFDDPQQDLVPPWYFGDEDNLFFSVLSLGSPADSMVRLRLTQDLNWPVVATRPDIVRLLPGDTLRLGYRVDFPVVAGAVQNRFRLQVISMADSNHRGTSSVVALAGVQAAPALAPWGLAVAAVLLSAVAALAIRRAHRAAEAPEG